MTTGTFRATAPLGAGIVVATSLAVAFLVLFQDSEVAPKIWLVLALCGFMLLLIWGLAKQRQMNAAVFDQAAWVLLLSHTVLVARIRDPRILAQEQGLTNEIAAEILIWCLCLVYAAGRFLMEPSLLKNLWGPISRYATLLMLLAVISASYAASPLITLAWSLKLITILALCCLLFDKADPIGASDNFLTATYWGLLLMLGQFVVLGFASPEAAVDRSTITGITRAGGFLLPATKLSAVAGLTSLLALIDILSRRSRQFGKIALGVSAVLMFASLGRGGMLATLVSALVAIAAFRRMRLTVLLGCGVAIVFLAFPSLMTMTWDLVSRRQQMHEIAELTGRVPLWQNAVELIRMKPVLGWGYVSGGRVAFLQIYSWWAAPHAHNALLEILLDLGILGATTLLILLWKTCARTIGIIRSTWNASGEDRDSLISLRILCVMIFLFIEGMLEAGFSGAPRFETAILIGSAFAVDSLVRGRAAGR